MISFVLSSWQKITLAELPLQVFPALQKTRVFSVIFCSMTLIFLLLEKMMMLFPLMEAVRSGGDLENVGGSDRYTKDIVCPDGCVMFRLTAKPLGNENFFKGKFYD